MPRTLTVEQTGEELLFCGSETVLECIHARGLPAVKVGRAWVLVDEDVINWLRSQYQKGADSCESTPAESAASSGLTPPSQASALHAALAPRPASRRKSTPRTLRSIPGGRAG